MHAKSLKFLSGRNDIFKKSLLAGTHVELGELHITTLGMIKGFTILAHLGIISCLQRRLLASYASALISIARPLSSLIRRRCIQMPQRLSVIKVKTIAISK